MNLIQSDKASVRCIWSGGALLGESPLWDFREKCLYWVDIKGKTIHRYRPDDETVTTISVPEEIGCIALRRAGGLVAATRSGFAFIDPNNGLFRIVAMPEHDQPGNRFNDGKCDRRGRFWAGTMDDAAERASGALYRLSPDLAVSRMLTEVTIPNGIGWSPDNQTMYFTDSAQQMITAFDFDGESGEICSPEVFALIAVADGTPDGLTVDADGYIWSAHWDGWRVTRYNSEGVVDRVIMLPVPRPTSCAFGGELLNRLYVTSASIGLLPEQLGEAPLSGGLFELNVGITGCREPCFLG